MSADCDYSPSVRGLETYRQLCRLCTWGYMGAIKTPDEQRVREVIKSLNPVGNAVAADQLFIGRERLYVCRLDT